jgi:uncharacterized coiled-coil DUF342 family protein
MNKQTKIDDMLIERISPKLKEIEERFSKGEGLSNEDINTLLLKSQFNHINHLDQKLNEVTANVSSLKLDFANLRAEVKSEIGTIKIDMAEMRTDMATMRTEVQSAINNNMQWSI